MSHELNASAIAVAAGCIVLWGLASARLLSWNIGAPMALVVLGLVTANGPVALIHVNLESTSARAVVEVTLAVVLFADACRVNVREIRLGLAIPARLLCIGLPLTIGMGTVVAFGFFSGAGIWVAAALGAIIAPTDAALGAQIMEDARVPGAVRRALNVESGLNDGIVTPFVNLFLAGALSAEAVSVARGVGHGAIDLVGGAGVGVGVGTLGALLLAWSRRAGWSDRGFRPLLVLALAILAYSASLTAGTNGFVAAFVAGMAFGSLDRGASHDLFFTEEAGKLLSLLVWFIFGAVMLVPGLKAASWADVAFGVLALTVVRMVPVAISLVGAGVDRATVVFMGWFGPRGLASVVFGLVAIDSLDSEAAHVVLGAVTVTVAMSVLAHGMSASPFASRYADQIKGVAPDSPEHVGHPPIPTRHLSGTLGPAQRGRDASEEPPGR